MYRSLPSVLSLSLFLVACGGSKDEPLDDTDAPDDTDAIGDVSPFVGVWKAEEGDLFSMSPYLGQVGYLVFEPLAENGSSGVLSFFGAYGTSGVLSCHDALYVGQEGGLVISNRALLGGAIVTLAEVDGDVLTITGLSNDLVGGGYASATRTQTFRRVDEVPAEARCREAEAELTVTFEIDRESFANLIWDGTDLRLALYDGDVVALDLETGTVGNPVDYSSSHGQLLVAQGSDAWGHCGCGGSEEIARSTPAGVHLDMFHSVTDFGIDVGFRYGAFDGTHLWVGGTTHGATKRPVLLQVDAEVEPDVLVETHELEFDPDAITFFDGEFYAIVGSSLVRFEPSTGRASATWKLPPSSGEWSTLTTDGTHLYVGADIWLGRTGFEVARLAPLE